MTFTLIITMRGHPYEAQKQNSLFTCSAYYHEQDWQPYPVDPYSAMIYVMAIQGVDIFFYAIWRNIVFWLLVGTFGAVSRAVPPVETVHGILRT